MTDYLGHMLRVGLTGGIGSGKSAVAARLQELGAFVVDADQVARDVVEPGQPALAAIVARFSAEVLQPDGRLDRARLAQLVFADPRALADLNAIIHPRMDQRTQELITAAQRAGAQVLVHDLALLVELGRAGEYDLVIVVVAPLDTRLERLVRRGLAPADARARIAAQASDAARLAVADIVIDNGGPLAATHLAVDAAWEQIRSAGRARGVGDVRPPA